MAQKVQMAQNQVKKIRHSSQVPYDANKMVSACSSILHSPYSVVIANDHEIQNAEIQNNKLQNDSPI